MHAKGELLPPAQPASAVARLVLHVRTEAERKALHGQFVNWNDPKLK